MGKLGPVGDSGERGAQALMPQGFKSNSLSFFAAVPNWPSW